MSVKKGIEGNTPKYYYLSLFGVLERKAAENTNLTTILIYYLMYYFVILKHPNERMMEK